MVVVVLLLKAARCGVKYQPMHATDGSCNVVYVTPREQRVSSSTVTKCDNRKRGLREGLQVASIKQHSMFKG